MILFYYGTDAGRLSEASSILTERYRAKHGGTNLFLCDATEPEQLNTALGALKSRSFFSEPTFVSIRDAFSSPEAAQALTETLADGHVTSDKEVVLLFREQGTEKELAKNHKLLWKSLTEQAQITILDPLSGGQLTAWMQKFCKERGCTLSPAVAALLVATVGDESRTLVNEMSKLCAWQQQGILTEQAVRVLATPTDRQANVFALTDAISERSKRGVLRELHSQMAMGNEAHYLLSMYAFAIRNLITIKDLAERGLTAPVIAKQAGMHPYVAKKGLVASRNYETDELTRAHAWLAQADKDTKNGVRDATDTLYDFVLSVL